MHTAFLKSITNTPEIDPRRAAETSATTNIAADYQLPKRAPIRRSTLERQLNLLIP